MTNEERDLISRFVARVGGAPQSGGFLGGSVPSSQPALPPVDKEADQFLAEQFGKYPEARYRMTQTAMVQEAALEQAQKVIQDLQAQLQQARSAPQQSQSQGQKSGGFLSSIFGGGGGQPQGQPQRPSGPWGGQPQAPQGYPPQQQPQYGQPQYGQPQAPGGGMFGRGGSGFLGSALTTAAGVAGGMVVGNALMNAFSGHGGGWGGAGGASNPISDNGAFGGAGMIPSDPAAGFDSNASFNDPFGGGGTEKDFSGGGSGGGFENNTGWDQGGGGGGGGFDQGGGGGGFDQGGGGFDDAGGFDDNT